MPRGSHRLLLDTPARYFQPELAEWLGLNEAIVVQEIHWALGRDNVEEHDGRIWVHLPLAWWTKRCPWWSESTIRRALHELDGGGVVRRRRGREGIDFTVDHDRLRQIEQSRGGQDDQSDWSNRPVGGGQDDQSLVYESGKEREEGEEQQVATTTGHLPGLEPEEPASKPESGYKNLWDRDEVIADVWEHFLREFPDTARQNITTSRRRLIAKALREVIGTLEDPESEVQAITFCKRAITGLKAWRTHKKGDESLSAVFATKPNGSALGDQIEFFASQAGDMPDIDLRVPSVLRATVYDCRGQVTEMYRSPSRSTQERGEQALAWLRDRAFEEPVVTDGQVTGWRRIDQ